MAVREHNDGSPLSNGLRNFGTNLLDTPTQALATLFDNKEAPHHVGFAIRMLPVSVDVNDLGKLVGIDDRVVDDHLPT